MPNNIKPRLKVSRGAGALKLRRRINDAREEIEEKFKAEKPRNLCETRFTNSFPLRLFADILFCKFHQLIVGDVKNEILLYGPFVAD